MLIFLLSSLPTLPGPKFALNDKVAHFGAYGVLATLCCRLGRGWRAAGWSFLAASLYGATDEWHQSFVPGRETELADWIADTLGAAVAVTVYTGWPAYRRLLERPIRRRQAEARTGLLEARR